MTTVLLLGGMLVCLSESSASAADTSPGPEVTPPVVVTQVEPVAAEVKLKPGEAADVVLVVVVDLSGDVAAVEVRESSRRDLDPLVVSAVQKWKFAPAQRDGHPVRSRIRVPLHLTAAASTEVSAAPLPAPSSPAAAGPTAPRAAPTAEPAAHLETAGTDPDETREEVRVIGRSVAPSRGASDFNLRIGELSRVPRKNASDLLKLAPSIMLTNEGGEGHAEQVFLRGFDAREGQDIEFSVGGVPINESGNLHGNGYADTHFVLPELVESLRVVEGPFDPRQGNYAVAGSANFELGLAQRGLTTRYTTGSFNTQRLVVLWGPAGESQHTFGGGEVYSSDGFGQNRDSQRGSAMGQYEGRLGSKGSYRIDAQAYAAHFHTAGLVREDDFRSGRMGFYDSYGLSSFARQQTPEGGDSSRYSVSADLESRTSDTTFAQQVFLIKRDMRLLENFTGYLLDVQEPLQSLHAQRGDMLDLNVHEVTLGARGSARLRGTAFGQKQELELGYFARGDDAAGTQQRLEANTGVPYKTESNLDSRLGDIGLYADANVKPVSFVTMRGGVRTDILTYDVHDNCAAQTVAHPSTTNPPIDQSCLTQQDFGRPREPDQHTSTSSVALLPRGSVLVGPFQGFLFSASYGQGIRSIDPSYVTQDVKTPFASITAYEGGASYAGEVKKVAVVARSIFFQTHVDKDLIFSQTEGRNVLGEGTTRTGWAGALRLTGTFFDESANVTFVRATYDDTHLLVAYVPDVVVRSDTAFFHALPFTLMGEPFKGALSSGITYVGPRPLPFGQRSQDLFTVDISGTLSWSRYELGLMTTNLLGTQYRLGEYNFASDFHSQRQATLVPERAFTAGAPRGVYLTIGVNFGGGS